jgi:Flp pilus assembly protein TadD
MSKPLAIGIAGLGVLVASFVAITAGAVLMTVGNIQEALLANETASRLDPQDAIALYNLSNALKALGRLDDAEVGYRNSILLKPDFAEAYLNLGVLLQESGRFEDAEASYRKAITKGV